MTFFNTTNLKGAELQQAQEASATIKAAVAGLFQDGLALSPWQALALIGNIGKRGTINGVRTAITTLTDEGLLEKTDEMRKGPYGRSEHVWSLANA